MAESGLRRLFLSGPLRQRLRWLARAATPSGILWWRILRRQRHALREIEAKAAEEAPPARSRVEAAVRFLTERGLDEHQVREGSIPEGSLDYMRGIVLDRLPGDRPVRALHVGNFVGVSLCYVTWLVRERHPDSVIVSIDPNLAHRGIENPQAQVFALLGHFGLLGNNVVVPGYTLEQTPGESMKEFIDADYTEGLACRDVLHSLARLCGEPFDLALVDGSHDRSYLERELATLRGLLADDGMIVLDDVGNWAGVADVFGRALQDDRFVTLGQDGRVGILQLRAAPTSRSSPAAAPAA